MTDQIRRLKIKPTWADRILADKWNDGYGYIQNDEIHLPVHQITDLEVSLQQVGEKWACVARANSEADAPDFFTFSILSFIHLWNLGTVVLKPASVPEKLTLLADIEAPVLYRHPSIVPMEISYNHRTDRFDRSLIYTLTDLNNLEEISSQD